MSHLLEIIFFGKKGGMRQGEELELKMTNEALELNTSSVDVDSASCREYSHKLAEIANIIVNCATRN